MDDFWKAINLSPVNPPAAAATFAAAFPPGPGFFHTPGLHEFPPLPIEIGGSTSLPPASSFSSVSSYSKPAPPPPQLVRKRRPGSDDGSDPERRHQRLIKNRESADRSRAKKIAYTEELEIKVHCLKQENAKLKMQRGKLLRLNFGIHSEGPQEENKKLRRSLTI